MKSNFSVYENLFIILYQCITIVISCKCFFGLFLGNFLFFLGGLGLFAGGRACEEVLAYFNVLCDKCEL